MELVQVNVVRLQVFQTSLQMIPKGLHIGGAGLCRNGNLIPHI